MPTRPAAMGVKGCLLPVSELKIFSMSLGPADQALTNQRRGHRLEQRSELGPMQPAGQCRAERREECRAFLPGRSAQCGEVRAFADRRGRGPEELRTRRVHRGGGVVLVGQWPTK